MGLPLSSHEIDDQPRAVENVTADYNFMRFFQILGGLRPRTPAWRTHPALA